MGTKFEKYFMKIILEKIIYANNFGKKYFLEIIL